jgi:hypothetical protein
MWTTAFALPHTERVIEERRHHSRSVGCDRSTRGALIGAVQQHHDIHALARVPQKKLTAETPREFGFFSGLRAMDHVIIMRVRFDLTVLIGT